MNKDTEIKFYILTENLFMLMKTDRVTAPRGNTATANKENQQISTSRTLIKRNFVRKNIVPQTTKAAYRHLNGQNGRFNSNQSTNFQISTVSHVNSDRPNIWQTYSSYDNQILTVSHFWQQAPVTINPNDDQEGPRKLSNEIRPGLMNDAPLTNPSSLRQSKLYLNVTNVDETENQVDGE